MTAFADTLARRRVESDGHIQLAAHLPGWQPASPRSSMLHGPNGGQLLIDIVGHGNKRRAHIIPRFPTGMPFLDNYHSTTITVALGRTAASIARDITNRLLPGYIADLDEKHAIMESQKDNRALQRERADQILALDPDCREQPQWFRSTRTAPARPARQGNRFRQTLTGPL